MDLTWTPAQQLRRQTLVMSSIAAVGVAAAAGGYFGDHHNVRLLAPGVLVAGVMLLLVLVVQRTRVALEGTVLYADGIAGKRTTDLAAAAKLVVRNNGSGRLELSAHESGGQPTRVTLLDSTRIQPPAALRAMAEPLSRAPAANAPELATSLLALADLLEGSTPSADSLNALRTGGRFIKVSGVVGGSAALLALFH